MSMEVQRPSAPSHSAFASEIFRRIKLRPCAHSVTWLLMNCVPKELQAVSIVLLAKIKGSVCRIPFAGIHLVGTILCSMGSYHSTNQPGGEGWSLAPQRSN